MENIQESIQLNNKQKRQLVADIKEFEVYSNFLRNASEEEFQRYLGEEAKLGRDHSETQERKKIQSMTDEEYLEYLKKGANTQIETALKSPVLKIVANVGVMSDAQKSKRERMLNLLRSMKEAFIDGIDPDDLLSVKGITEIFSGILLGAGATFGVGCLGLGLLSGNQEAIKSGIVCAIVAGTGATPFALFGATNVIRESIIPTIKSRLGYKKLERLGLLDEIKQNGVADLSNRPEISELREEIGRAL